MTLTEKSATELARGIRGRAYSARAVVEAHIARLEQVNPVLNAVVVPRYDEARLAADAADEMVAMRRSSDLPPLLGVPITIKESLAVAGLPNTAGVVARRASRPKDDATVVKRVLDAGAILLGLTNTSEGCMWIETDNRVYGRTNNAYDPTRTAGGSSGGEGAAVGSGGSPVGLATDTLGSIRVPAMWNGVFGHRPTTGLVPLTGAWPPPLGVAHMCSNGIIARRAEDLMLLLRVMAGPDGIDPLARPFTLAEPDTSALDGVRLTVIDDAFLPGVGREMLRARDEAATALEALGARIEHRSMKSLRSVGFFTTIVLANETGRRFGEIMNDEGASPTALSELLAWRGDHTAAMRLLMVGEFFASILPKRLARQMVRAAHAMAERITDHIGDGLLLHPTLTTVAPRHGRTNGRPWRTNGVAPSSLAGLPVTQIPLGLGRTGLPVGVQAIAAPGNDHVTIAAALGLERALGGWVPPRSTRQ